MSVPDRAGVPVESTREDPASGEDAAAADARGQTPAAQDDTDLSCLMEAYQRGDSMAFDRLYERVAPQLWSYLAFLAGSAGRADDLLQECFLQIHRARRTYFPGRPVRPWAFAIARHVFRMDRRARGRRRRHETRYPVIAWSECFEFERLAQRDDLACALARLAPHHREPLVLHHAFGLSFAEIGALLGIRSGTAKLRAHRGMMRLRSHLAPTADAASRDRANEGSLGA